MIKIEKVKYTGLKWILNLFKEPLFKLHVDDKFIFASNLDTINEINKYISEPQKAPYRLNFKNGDSVFFDKDMFEKFTPQIKLEQARLKIKDNKIDRFHTNKNYEQILGSEQAVGEFKNFYEQNPFMLQIVVCHLFDEYWQNNEVSREEIAAYKQALDDFISFFSNATAEIIVDEEIRKNEAEEKDREEDEE